MPFTAPNFKQHLDDLDGIFDGDTFGRTLRDALGPNGEIDLGSASGWLNRNIEHLSRTSDGATLDDIVQNLDSSGEASSLDQLSRDISAEVFVDPAETIKFGTVLGGASAITKTISYPATFFDPRDHLTVFAHHPSAGYVHPNQTSDTSELVGTIVLPPQATITELRARMYRDSTGNAAAVRIFENGDSPSSVSGTEVALASHSGTGWSTASDTGLSLTVGSNNYFFFVELNAVGGSAEDARLLWVELDYEIDDVKQSI